MIPRYDVAGRRAAVDSKLTDLALYAKELCPGAVVEASPLQYEDEDGHIEVFPPAHSLDAEVDELELALAARSSQIFDDTGLYIVCAVLDASPR
jgi:hypothetical protein